VKKKHGELERLQVIIECGACVLHAGQPRLQTHTQNIILIAFPGQQWFCERAFSLHAHYLPCSCLGRKYSKINWNGFDWLRIDYKGGLL
jgi:hypothetical protein